MNEFNLTELLILTKKRCKLPQTEENKNLKDWRNEASRSSGLYNSALATTSLPYITYSHVKEVEDANRIDSEVFVNTPKIVILEALWCPPSKLQELVKLHPKVTWVIRIHSEIPFLANEGIAIGYIKSYLTIPNTYIACNSERIQKTFERILGKRILLLPNYYPKKKYFRTIEDIKQYRTKHDEKYINISCFGAIRPMKNHLMQACAAIAFADRLNKKLRFHVNGTRKEGNGENVLKNLQALFHLSTKHTLVDHPWLDHEDFTNLLRHMDIGMQVSMSETFNIVIADHIYEHIPVVASKEVPIVDSLFTCDPTNFNDIVSKLKRTYYWSKFGAHYLNNNMLYVHNLFAKYCWKQFFKEFLK